MSDVRLQPKEYKQLVENRAKEQREQIIKYLREEHLILNLSHSRHNCHRDTIDHLIDLLAKCRAKYILLEQGIKCKKPRQS